MKLFAPKYYKDFTCIADKCKHSCCIGWEIDIDEKTMNRYSSLIGEYSENIRSSIEIGDAPHFKLADNERCPHLNEKGLCNIIINCGERYLCDICREHPRFYNFTNLGKEVGLGLSCEEACRLILSSDDYDEMIYLGEAEGETDACEFDAIAEREILYRILKDNTISYGGKIEMIYDYFDVYVDDLLCKETFEKLEYLDPSHKKLFCELPYTFTINPKNDEKLVRLLAYFIYRHCSESCDFEEFFASLSFAVLLTRLIGSTADGENINEISRIVSEEIEYSEENTELLKSLFL